MSVKRPPVNLPKIPKVCTWGEHETSINRQNKDRAIDPPLGS